MNELIAKKNKIVPFTDLLCLCYLLGYMNQSDLLNNSHHIYKIVSEYFKYGMEHSLSKEEKIATVEKYKNRLSFVSVQTIEMEQFKDKVAVAMHSL